MLSRATFHEELEHRLPESQADRPKNPTVGFGPDSGWASWQWVGRDVMDELSPYYRVVHWIGQRTEIDVLVAIKFLPDTQTLRDMAQRMRIIYCPIDVYGSEEEIAADAERLKLCSLIVVHCERLRAHFEPFARVAFMDHHVKFVTAELCPYNRYGPLVWVGVREHLPSLVSWVNQYGLPAPLLVLTNLETKYAAPSPQALGFR